MGFFDELNDKIFSASLTLSGGAGEVDIVSLLSPMAVKAIIVDNDGGTTTAGATFTLKSNGTGLADWAIPNGYTQDAVITKTINGYGPSNYPAGSAGPLPATGAVTNDRQVLPAGTVISLAVASGTGSDVLKFYVVCVPGGNLDTQA